MSVISLEQFAARLRAAPGEFRQLLEREGLRLALRGEAAAKENATRTPRARTGRLRASIQGRSEVGREGVTLRLQAGDREVRYAKLQEVGGTVTGRPYLRIPLPPALTGAGVDRYASPLRATAPGQFYLRRSKAGNLLLFNRADGRPWYVLKSSVTVRGSRFLGLAFDALEADARARLPQLLADALETS